MILILVVSLPMYAFATGIDTEAEEITVDNTTYVMRELAEKREANVKYYLLSDRTSRAVVYPYDVHYLDENGKWQDIDNTLTLSQGNYEAKGKTEVKFAKKSGSTGLVSIKDGGYKIDFTPLNASKSTAKITNSEKTDSRKFDEIKLLSGIKSEVLYEDIYENTDIQYVLKGLSLKENIVVKAARDSYSYEIELKLNGLKAELENGKIIFLDYDTSEVKYTIPMPYMYDANGRYSDKVEFTLVNKGKWQYILTVTADAEWINSEETAFPVTIDPTIETHTSGTIASKENMDMGIFFIGAHPMMGGVSEVYCPVTIPSVPSNAVITNVMMGVYCDETSTSDFKVGAYRITSSWTSSSILNSEPAIATNPVDYVKVKSGYPMWDITELYKDWQNGTYSNYGVCLKEMTGSTSNYAAIPEDSTIVEVTYIDTMGIEEYFSYYSSSVSGGGTGYVNSYTGGLTFAHNIFSTADEAMPYSLSYVYTAPGSWKLSSMETLTQTTLADGQTCFIWVDGDGSSHYFTKIRQKLNSSSGIFIYYEYNDSGNLVQNNSTTKYYDNEGLGLKLVSGSSSGEYIISDDTGNKKYFSNGKITKIEDATGNKKQFTYSSSSTSAITFYPKGNSTGISQITITNNSSGRPTRITNVQTGVYVDFTYSGTKLTQAVYTYGTGATETVVFGYDSSNRLTSVKNNTTLKGVEYSYSGNKVVKITEVAYNGSTRNEGNYANITYSTGYTTYRTPGSDRSSTSDDISTVYKFDYKGRVITAYTADEQGNIYGSSNYVYNDMNTDKQSTVKTNNTLNSVIQSSYNSINLLNNPDFEYSSSTASYWTADSTCSIVAPGSTNIANNNRVKLQRSSAGTSTIKQSVYLSAGTYTFSVSAMLSEMENTGKFILKAYSSSNTVLKSQTVTKDVAINYSAWHKDSITFTVTSAGTYYVEIGYQSTTSAQSAIYVDETMLEKSTGMGTFSCYPNGSFEGSQTGSGSNKAVSTTNTMDGRYSMRLSSGISKEAYCTYTFYPETDDSPNVSKIVSAWAYAPDSVQSANTASSDATFAIHVKSYYQDGRTETEKIPFNPQCNGWQYACGKVPLTHLNDLYTANPITKIEISLRYDYNIGYAYFDCVSMQRAVDYTSYEYNSMGYTSEVNTSDGKSSSYTYDSTQTKVTGVTDKEDRNYTYEYNSDGTVSSSGYMGNSTTEKFGTDYTYNSLGQVLSTKTVSRDGKTLFTYGTYNTDTTKAYYTKPATTVDERGNVTKYFYYSNGLLKGICLNDGIGTLYEYNAYGVLICAKEAVYSNGDIVAKSSPSSVLYTYNSKLELSEITTLSTVYKMYYDVFGKTDYMKVGNTTLADYTYAANNGNLTRLDYGNGAYVTYTYDKLDRIVGECYNGVQRATYTYAPNGNVSIITDHTNGMNYLYYYSSDGEISSVRVCDNSGELKYFTRYTYNELGKLTNKGIYFTSNVQSSPPLYKVDYTYDPDGNVTSIDNVSGAEYYSYDNLGRLTTNRFETFYTETYTYVNGTLNNFTTGLVETVSSTLGSTSTVSYTYDARGNIVQEARSVGGSIYYTYDDLDQLIREDNNVTGRTYTYTYDKAGNILTKKVYSYTRATTPSLLLESYTYSYGNSNWKDQLTSFNGNSITYDGIGNPLSYYNGSSYTFTWQNGRELASAVKGSNSVSYKYNTDGIRVSKIVNGILHEYTLDGNKVAREVIYTGSTNSYSIDEDLRYYYDANGYLSSIDRFRYDGGSSYTRIQYFAKTNLQGDVLALYSYSGSTYTLAASYSYDAWGNVITATASNSSDIVNLNPFRYRSYYYDTELGMYYLNTRYYDPQVGRFINADGQLNDGLLGYNLYAYCENNPVMYADRIGESGTLTLIGLGALFAQAVAAVVVTVVVAVVVTAVVELVYEGVSNIIDWAEEQGDNQDKPSDKPQNDNPSKPPSLPTEGDPNSEQDLYDENGELKQKRFYGPDGKAERDIDYKHGGNHDFPHEHTWDWSKNPPRSKH